MQLPEFVLKLGFANAPSGQHNSQTMMLDVVTLAPNCLPNFCPNVSL